jgi:hypothetical protein
LKIRLGLPQDWRASQKIAQAARIAYQEGRQERAAAETRTETNVNRMGCPRPQAGFNGQSGDCARMRLALEL